MAARLREHGAACVKTLTEKPYTLHLNEGLSRTLARSPSAAGASMSSTSASSGPGSPGAAARRASNMTTRAPPRAVSRSSSGGGQATAGRRYCRNAACHGHRPRPLYQFQYIMLPGSAAAAVATGGQLQAGNYADYEACH